MAEANSEPLILIEYDDLPDETIFLEVIEGTPMEFWPLFNSIKKMRVDWLTNPRELKKLRKNFQTASDICYGCIVTVNYVNYVSRKYYIMRYMPFSTQMFFNFLNEMYDRNTNNYKEWLGKRQFRKQELCVVSMGGGPGTELFALDAHFRYLRKKINYLHQMECIVLENNMREWRDEFGVLNVGETETGVVVDILNNVEYQNIDLTSDGVQDWMKRADIVTVNKYLTSIADYDLDKKMFSIMKKDALVLYMNVDSRTHNARDVRSAIAKCHFRKIRESKTTFVVGEMALPEIPTISTAKLNFQALYKYS